MSTEALSLLPSHFLDLAAVTRLHSEMLPVVQAGASRAIGVWSSETLFAIVVEVREGIPARWHLSGPFSREAAAHWFHVIDTEIHETRPMPRPPKTSH